MREEIIVRNVAKLVQVPRPRYRTGKGLSAENIKRLLVEAKEHRLYPLFLTAATLGLRRGELLGLRWSDLDLDKGTVEISWNVQRVKGQLLVKRTKTEESDGTIPLPVILWDALKTHRIRQAEQRLSAERWDDPDLVFPTSVGSVMEPRSLNREWEKLRARIGMNDVNLHDLRHTVVTLLLELGVPPHIVQAIARHADIDVTMKIYAHANLDAMRDGLSKLNEHLK